MKSHLPYLNSNSFSSLAALLPSYLPAPGIGFLVTAISRYSLSPSTPALLSLLPTFSLPTYCPCLLTALPKYSLWLCAPYCSPSSFLLFLISSSPPRQPPCISSCSLQTFSYISFWKLCFQFLPMNSLSLSASSCFPSLLLDVSLLSCLNLPALPSLDPALVSCPISPLPDVCWTLPLANSLRGRHHSECPCSTSATPSWGAASWGWLMPWPTRESSSFCEFIGSLWGVVSGVAGKMGGLGQV